MAALVAACAMLPSRDEEKLLLLRAATANNKKDYEDLMGVVNDDDGKDARQGMLPGWSCFVPMDSISMCLNTLYMSNMDAGSSLRWLSASTMT